VTEEEVELCPPAICLRESCIEEILAACMPKGVKRGNECGKGRQTFDVSIGEGKTEEVKFCRCNVECIITAVVTIEFFSDSCGEFGCVTPRLSNLSKIALLTDKRLRMKWLDFEHQKNEHDKREYWRDRYAITYKETIEPK